MKGRDRMEQNPGALPPGFSFVTFESDALPELADPAATKLICVNVAYGDTLSGIAALFDTTAGEIARMNGIDDPDRIFPGQRLILRVPRTTPVAACADYTVRRGDTLPAIADRLGLTLRALVDANPQLIAPGQSLRLSGR